MVDFRKAVMLLTEAVRINNGKEAVNLIKNKQIGVKIHPSYNTANLDELIPSFDILISKVGASNAAFAVQLAVNKIPAFKVKGMFKSRVNDYGDDAFITLISNRNKAWVKQIPGFMDAITLNNKVPFEESKWKSVADKIDEQAGSHGKATKGSGNSNEVKELYNDGTWTLQVPTSWEGEKAAAFYGKKGEKQTPTEWCTRVDKIYYDEYRKNSPLYIIRNWETGKSYQIAFDKTNVHFLDQNDVKGDEITKGDINSIPDKLLKLIKWNKKTLLDYKKESQRTELKKGELKNPTSDFKNAEWEKPVDEGDGIVSQVMHNLYNNENRDDFTVFMIQGKSFKFHKRNNYAKKFYYKNKPNYIVIAVFSKVGSIRGDIMWPFNISNGKMDFISSAEKFNQMVGDNGKLISKVKMLKDATDKKRFDRKNIKNQEYYKDQDYRDRMAKMLNKYIIQEYDNVPGLGINSKYYNIDISASYRSRYLTRQEDEKVGNALPTSIGSFVPYEFTLTISSKTGLNDKIELKFYVMNGKSTLDKKLIGSEVSEEFVKPLEKATDNAIKKFSREAIHDKYGIARRSEFRERSKYEASYDINSRRKLQLESYLS